MAETKVKTVRISDDLWTDLLVKTAQEGTTASAVIRDLVDEWVHSHD